MSKRFDDSSRYKYCLICGAVYAKKVIKEGEPPRHVCESCGHIHFIDPKIAAIAMFQSQGGIVMIRRAIEPAIGKWVCPGGFVERGETPEQTCVREALEESSVEIEVEQLLNVYAYPDNIVIIVAYAARLISGRPEAADESSELRAFRPDEIPWNELAFTSTRESLEDYIAYLRNPAVRPRPALARAGALR